MRYADLHRQVIESSGGRVFPISYRHAYNLVRRATGFRPHDLRYLFVMKILIETRDIEKTRRWLAHSSYVGYSSTQLGGEGLIAVYV